MTRMTVRDLVRLARTANAMALTARRGGFLDIAAQRFCQARTTMQDARRESWRSAVGQLRRDGRIIYYGWTQATGLVEGTNEDQVVRKLYDAHR